MDLEGEKLAAPLGRQLLQLAGPTFQLGEEHLLKFRIGCQGTVPGAPGGQS
ncbi:hypothetical protein [Synechococcus sp. BSA11S]|uniref:hypothetical protein n=1 Tax=Synechococcus sp. BSA11S TaxID=2599077 RepID=UPI00162814B5|nr:hypothetical protein [Synechococcus sp. BSA11S]